MFVHCTVPLALIPLSWLHSFLGVIFPRFFVCYSIRLSLSFLYIRFLLSSALPHPLPYSGLLFSFFTALLFYRGYIAAWISFTHDTQCERILFSLSYSYNLPSKMPVAHACLLSSICLLSLSLSHVLLLSSFSSSTVLACSFPNECTCHLLLTLHGVAYPSVCSLRIRLFVRTCFFFHYVSVSNHGALGSFPVVSLATPLPT